MMKRLVAKANNYDPQQIPRDKEKMKSVTSKNRCALCGGKDGCSRGDKGLLLCRRKRGEIPGFVYMEQAKRDEQFAQYRRADDPILQPAVRPGRQLAPRPAPAPAPANGTDTAPARDLTADAKRDAKALTPKLRSELADLLGLPVSVLATLPLLGYRANDGGGCWTFPELDGTGCLVGISRRYRDGTKKALPGTHRGLTVPTGWDKRDQTILLPEGQSDTLALTALTLAAVGRPSNTGGVEQLAELLRAVPSDRKIIVLAEMDANQKGQWPGRDGAVRTATRLSELLRRPVAWCLPPNGAKDARAWVRAQQLDRTGEACADSWSEAGIKFLTAILSQCQYVEAEPTGDLLIADGWQPFPLDTLPYPVRTYTAEAAAAIGCDPAFIALPLLTALGAAIGNTRRIQLKRGWMEPPILWTGIVGFSGMLKSPGLDAALGFVRERQHSAFADYHYAQEQAKKVQATGGKADEPDPPARYVVNDITMEALAVRLKDAPRGLLLERDELAGWLKSFDAYRQGRGGDLQHYLTLHRAGDLCFDRKTGDKDTIFVRRAAVAVTGGIQPGTLKKVLSAECFEAGLSARLLLAMPPRTKHTWTETEINPDTHLAMARIFDRLWALEAEALPDEPRPVLLSLTHDGKAAWIPFYNAHAAEMADRDGDLAAAWSKLEGYCARLALILHCCRGAADDPTIADPERVDFQSVEAAVKLVHWFGRETERIYRMLRQTETESEESSALGWIKGRGGITTVREYQRAHSCTAKEAEAVLARLVQAKRLWIETSEPNPRGGPPVTCYRVS
jgi:hypothetical protein